MAQMAQEKTNAQMIAEIDAFQQRVQECTEERQHANNRGDLSCSAC
jgi:hypothetical protein